MSKKESVNRREVLGAAAALGVTTLALGSVANADERNVTDSNSAKKKKAIGKADGRKSDLLFQTPFVLPVVFESPADERNFKDQAEDAVAVTAYGVGRVSGVTYTVN
jgi:hypothetical protein